MKTLSSQTTSSAIRVFLAAMAAGLVSALGNEAASPFPVLAIRVENAILKLADQPGVPAQTKISAEPRNFPPGAKLNYSWKQVQDGLSPTAAPADKQKITFNATNRPEITASFPDWGIYGIRLTVTDPKSGLQASRNTWVNVWDSKSHIIVDGKPDPLAVAPGIAPPKIRNLSPDPGPFRHPRMLCTDEDWKDIHARCVEGTSKLAARAYKQLNDACTKGFDPKTKEAQLAAMLETYADARFQGPAPDLSLGQPVPGSIYDSFPYKLSTILGDAAFLTWLNNDPSLSLEKLPPDEQARCRRLAKTLAGLCHAYLNVLWDENTGEFHKSHPLYLKQMDSIGSMVRNLPGIALAYDFLSPRMTEPERRATRNFLFATGAGRQSDGRHHGAVENRGVERGYQQNGNFPNLAEYHSLAGLVVMGEESGASPKIIETFLNPPKPPDYDNPKKLFAYDWTKPCFTDNGKDSPASRPYTDAMGWTNARKVDVDNLQRQIWWTQDGNTSPWGFIVERIAYHGSSTYDMWPLALVYARFGGQNQFVTGYFYNSVNQLIYNFYQGGPSGGTKSANFNSPIQLFEHHAGGGDWRQQHILLLKYMYPDDPAVDYAYAVDAPYFEGRVVNHINSCIFRMDPAIKDLTGAMAGVARIKRLPLTKLDPEEGVVVLRSGWTDDDMMITLDDGWKNCGHMNAEKNSFSLFALGRPWAIPTGFHKTHSNWQSGIHFQVPEWAACKTTQGYVGSNPCLPPRVTGCDYEPGFPSPPARLLECREAPDGSWSLAAGDAKAAYDFACAIVPGKERVGIPRANFLYPGLLEEMIARDPFYRKTLVDNRHPIYGFEDKYLTASPASAVQYANRSILMVRGRHPFALVVDDFKKEADGTGNYRWMFNNKSKFDIIGADGKPARGADGKPVQEFSMIMAPGSTPTEATLLFQQDSGEGVGKPRLLVRDVSEADNSRQPPIRMDQTVFDNLPEPKYCIEETNRLFIERINVAEPKFKVLLFPYRTGEKLPTTMWNAGKSALTIDFGDGSSRVIAFDSSHADHRTRITVKQ